jgi:hypothetical protein
MVLLHRYEVPISPQNIYFQFNVVFIYKTSDMCVFPASHLKVHAAIKKGLADEQSVYADFFCSWRHPFSPERQCFQGAEISAEKHNRAEKYFEGLVK